MVDTPYTSSIPGHITPPVPQEPAVTPTAVTNVSQAKKTVKPDWLQRWSILLVCWIVGVLVSLAFTPHAVWFRWRQFLAQFVLRSNYIQAADKAFEFKQYIIDRVVLHKTGFILLFLGDDYERGTLDPIAQTGMLLPGAYKHVQLRTDAVRMKGINPVVYAPGQSLYAVMYIDNGDGKVNLETGSPLKDTVARDGLGYPVVLKLTIR